MVVPLSRNRAKIGTPSHVTLASADLRHRVLFIADDHGGARDILESRVLHPELIGIAPRDLDADGHIPERAADDGEAGHVLADGGFTLPIEDRIDDGEGPVGRGVLGEDAEAAAADVQVLHLVANLGQRGQAGSDLEVHVAEDAVLRDVEADGNGGWIAAADSEVDVGHSRIERALVGIGNALVRRNAAGRAETGRGRGRSAPDRPARLDRRR